MPYLESEQQDETMNVTECDSEKAAVIDAQETTSNEQTKPRTVLSFVRLHLSMLSHSGHLSIGLSISINASVFSRLGLKPSRFFLI
jgi:hypothetical protein